MLSASSRWRGAFGGCGHGSERGRIAFGGRLEDRSVAAGFVGIIDKTDDEKERLTVMVSIFGRLTPVELGFDQVKK